MNVLSLFSGIGGLELGLERAGMTVVGQVEIDPFCRQVLAKHWPEVPKHDDVRTAVAWWLGESRPRVDVVAGGYPCQPDSLAGKRRGTGDERWLWPDMARVIHAIRPRYVVGENVMGHRTGGLRFVLGDLERLGYAARAGIVAAGEMGAPHRRQRIFVLAADTQRPAERDERGRGSGTDRQGAAVAGTYGAAQHVAYAVSEAGRPAAGLPITGGGSEAPGVGALQSGRRGSGGGYGQWWATEPNVGRVAHGVPARVDRLRALGNAVVPQVAEHIGRLVMAGAA